jgi:hypothetical protein
LKKKNNMIQEKTKEERLVLLNETIAHYSENVNRRCIKTTDAGHFKCKYSGTTIGNAESDGCAIGRLLTPELRIELDAKCGDTRPSGVDDLWSDLPDEIKAYGKAFLVSLQALHDEIDNWDEQGLSEDGKEYAESIKKGFCLEQSN